MMSKSTITVISLSTSVLRCLPPLLCIFIYTRMYIVKKQTATSFCFVLQSIRETSSVCFHFLLKGIICLPWQRFCASHGQNKHWGNRDPVFLAQYKETRKENIIKNVEQSPHLCKQTEVSRENLKQSLIFSIQAIRLSRGYNGTEV